MNREPLKRVVLFHTCLVNEFAPEVGLSAVKVLERLGYTVDVPTAQTCCGQPAFNSGFHDAASAAARYTIALLERTEGRVVVPSGSCGDMLVHQYPALLAGDAEWRVRAEAIAARTVEFSVFVAAHLERLDLAAVPASVAYHPSCHLLRGLHVDREPRAVLAAIPELDARPLPAEEECCGFGGLFSVKHEDISTRMRERKLANVAACGAERLVSCDMGCLLHLERGMRERAAAARVQHLAELLAEAIR